jgi:hypothetical protein
MVVAAAVAEVIRATLAKEEVEVEMALTRVRALVGAKLPCAAQARVPSRSQPAGCGSSTYPP